MQEIRRVVAQYGISRERAICFSRSLRRALYGYASYEMAEEEGFLCVMKGGEKGRKEKRKK